MKGIFPIDKFRTLQTPFYYYDTKVLRDTLSAINQEVAKYPSYSVHYAVKANANPKVLTIIRESGMGADCVSGGEIRAAVRAGFPANKIVFAGVGKADWEINLGLEYGIFCFNVESIPELEVINELAAAQNKIANVAFRINPDVGAHTHANITTGLAENKFGISMQDMDRVIDVALEMKNVKFIGLHFHIGSQILDMGDFIALCNRVNELQDKLEARRILVEHINVGGGFEGYTATFRASGSNRGAGAGGYATIKSGKLTITGNYNYNYDTSPKSYSDSYRENYDSEDQKYLESKSF